MEVVVTTQPNLLCLWSVWAEKTIFQSGKDSHPAGWIVVLIRYPCVHFDYFCLNSCQSSYQSLLVFRKVFGHQFGWSLVSGDQWRHNNLALTFLRQSLVHENKALPFLNKVCIQTIAHLGSKLNACKKRQKSWYRRIAARNGILASADAADSKRKIQSRNFRYRDLAETKC